MRFWRVCSVPLVMPNGVVTSGIVPPYSGPLPDPPVPMNVFTQSTGEVPPGTSAACADNMAEAASQPTISIINFILIRVRCGKRGQTVHFKDYERLLQRWRRRHR